MACDAFLILICKCARFSAFACSTKTPIHTSRMQWAVWKPEAPDLAAVRRTTRLRARNAMSAAASVRNLPADDFDFWIREDLIGSIQSQILELVSFYVPFADEDKFEIVWPFYAP
jgi:hypothetical protein